MLVRSLLFLLVCAAGCIGRAAARDVAITNFAGPVLKIADASASAAKRGTAVEQLLLPQRESVFRLFSFEDFRVACGQYAKRLEVGAPELRRLADEVATRERFTRYIAEFEAAFPRFDRTRLTIVLIPSLGYFNGQARPLAGKLTLMMDLEFLATAQPAALRALVHHELFHIYHYQIRPEAGAEAETALNGGAFPSLATLIWVEGMAACAARELNPAASDEDLSIHAVSARDENFWMILDAAMARLEESGKDAISGFFYFPRHDPPIPKDSGYTIGEALFRTARATHTWEQLLALNHSERVELLRTMARRLKDDRKQAQKKRAP